LGTSATIITDTIYLTTRININIHSRLDRGGGTRKCGWGYVCVTGVVHPTNTLGVSMVGVMMGVMVWGWVVGIRGSIAGGRMVGYMFGLVGVVCTMGEIWFAPRTFRWGPITGFRGSIARFRGSITGFRSSIARCGVRGMVRFGFVVCRFWRWRSIRFRCMVRFRGMIRCGCMVRFRGMVRFGFMVGWGRWGIGCRGMVRFNFW